MSKFDRHKKSTTETFIDPHRHCKTCNKMIEESIWYCPDCYKKSKEKKKKFWHRKKEKESDKDSNSLK